MSAKYIVVALFLGIMLGCGGTQKPKPGPMPQGAAFYGVWQSPQYGNMHICQSGTQVIGDYVKHERSGRIQGAIEGDLLTYQWNDTRELIAGHPKVGRGHGYFRIEIGEDGDQYLKGEWGLDDEYAGGGPRNAVKMRRGEPDRCTGEDEGLNVEEAPHPWDEEEELSSGSGRAY